MRNPAQSLARSRSLGTHPFVSIRSRSRVTLSRAEDPLIPPDGKETLHRHFSAPFTPGFCVFSPPCGVSISLEAVEASNTGIRLIRRLFPDSNPRHPNAAASQDLPSSYNVRNQLKTHCAPPSVPKPPKPRAPSQLPRPPRTTHCSKSKNLYSRAICPKNNVIWQQYHFKSRAIEVTFCTWKHSICLQVFSSEVALGNWGWQGAQGSPRQAPQTSATADAETVCET